MKNHAKVGNRSGRPAYRTPSTFRNLKQFAVMQSRPKRVRTNKYD